MIYFVNGSAVLCSAPLWASRQYIFPHIQHPSRGRYRPYLDLGQVPQYHRYTRLWCKRWWIFGQKGYFDYLGNARNRPSKHLFSDILPVCLGVSHCVLSLAVLSTVILRTSTICIQVQILGAFRQSFPRAAIITSSLHHFGRSQHYNHHEFYHICTRVPTPTPTDYQGITN